VYIRCGEVECIGEPLPSMASLQIGQIVCIDGLASHERPHLNGQVGTLAFREPGTGRWRIRLKAAPYETVKVAARVLHVLSQPSTDSYSSSREASRGPWQPRSHSSILHEESVSSWTWSKGFSSHCTEANDFDEGWSDLDEDSKAVWPLPPAIRVRQEIMKPPPHIVKGLLYAEMGCPRDVGRLRNQGMSILRDRAASHKPWPVNLQLPANLRHRTVEVLRCKGLPPLDSKALQQAVEDADARQYAAWKTSTHLDPTPEPRACADHLDEIDEDCQACMAARLREEQELQQRKQVMVPPLRDIAEDFESLEDVLHALPSFGVSDQQRMRQQRQVREELHREKQRARELALEEAFSLGAMQENKSVLPLGQVVALVVVEEDEEEKEEELRRRSLAEKAAIDPLWKPDEVEEFSHLGADGADAVEASRAARLLEVATALAEGSHMQSGTGRRKKFGPDGLEVAFEDEAKRIEREFEEYEQDSSRPTTRGKQDSHSMSLGDFIDPEFGDAVEFENFENDAAPVQLATDEDAGAQDGWDFEEDEDS